MKLYSVTTTVPELNGHRDVLLQWFVDKRAIPAQRPYAELVESYDPSDEYHDYREGAADELFDAAEAEALAAWLDANRGEGSTKIAEASLPLSSNIIGFGAIAVGGANDFLMVHDLTDLATSPLGFTVLGYYDLRGHEPLDKSVPARHRFCSVYVIEGKVISDYAEILDLWRAGKIEESAVESFP